MLCKAKDTVILFPPPSVALVLCPDVCDLPSLFSALCLALLALSPSLGLRTESLALLQPSWSMC